MTTTSYKGQGWGGGGKDWYFHRWDAISFSESDQITKFRNISFFSEQDKTIEDWNMWWRMDRITEAKNTSLIISDENLNYWNMRLLIFTDQGRITEVTRLEAKVLWRSSPALGWWTGRIVIGDFFLLNFDFCFTILILFYIFYFFFIILNFFHYLFLIFCCCGDLHK